MRWHRSIFKKPENWKMYYKETIRQMYDIGVGSIMIIFIVNVFIGAVTAVQFIYQLSGTLIPKYYIGYIVRDMALIELAVTFTSIILAGKVGSNIASEIGGMRQKEQIDALEVMGVDTTAYLVLPKIIAALTVIPMLVVLSAFMGMAGGYTACTVGGLVSEAEFMQGLRAFLILIISG